MAQKQHEKSKQDELSRSGFLTCVSDSSSPEINQSVQYVGPVGLQAFYTPQDASLCGSYFLLPAGR